MNSYKNIFLAAAFGGALVASTGCEDKFAEINSSPSQITTAEPSYLLARAVMEFEPCDYTYWFYDAPMLYSWNQMAVPTGSFNESFKVTTATGGVNHINVLKYAREIDYVLENMSAEDAAKHQATAACAHVLSIQLGINACDIAGDITYTEAARALHGGTITPKYDRTEDLYNEWLTELDNAIKVFTTATDQTFESKQDIIYQGKTEKWAKLANSLKLRIAARLISQDKATALKIAGEVANASCGYINSLDDDMLFNKGISNSDNNNNLIYHWNNGFMQGNAASQRIVNFMVKNQDPRVRFCYQKNEWNSEIVQAFYDRGKDIPSYIEENVDYTVDADGKKTFVAWKGLGEPWVRYYGLPVEFNAKDDAATYGDWFDYSNRCKITDAEGKSEKTYLPYSMFNHQMIIGRGDEFTLPTVPGGPVITKNVQRPWYGLYMGAAEVNLYLAEFALLGANVPGSAATYFKTGIEMSVKEYNLLAQKNQINYYGNTYDYDKNEAVIDLKDGEIETMLANDDYQLTGSAAEQLEKVYLQQMLNFTLYPYDAFVTSRRSGLPKFGSKFIAREDFSTVPVEQIPRRMHTGVPNTTSLMYDVTVESLKAQGFTATAQGDVNTTILNSERVWQDKNAPQWGAGPNN
jgi:hypothetical protein